MTATCMRNNSRSVSNANRRTQQRSTAGRPEATTVAVCPNQAASKELHQDVQVLPSARRRQRARCCAEKCAGGPAGGGWPGVEAAQVPGVRILVAPFGHRRAVTRGLDDEQRESHAGHRLRKSDAAPSRRMTVPRDRYPALAAGARRTVGAAVERQDRSMALQFAEVLLLADKHPWSLEDHIPRILATN